MVPEAEALPLMQQEQRKPRRFGAWYLVPALCVAAVTFGAARSAGGGGDGSAAAALRSAAAEGDEVTDVSVAAPPQADTSTKRVLSKAAEELAHKIASERGLEDLVTSLPGANFENSFAMFSGYLEVSETKRSFYWFTTARATDEATTKPLVMWTNGGPGCSGLLGFLTEHGPFRPQHDLSLEPFDFAWNKVANMLYIESPTGVGFSYGDEASGDYYSGDMSTAKDNFRLLQKFYERFPGLADNDLYLTGESYAGHYIPTLANLIVGEQVIDREGEDDATDAEASLTIGQKVAKQLKGIMVGNPYTDPVENVHGLFGALFGRSMVPAPMYHEWFQKCGIHSEERYYFLACNVTNTTVAVSEKLECCELSNAMFDVVGDIDPYGLDFDVCNRAQDESAAVGSENDSGTGGMHAQARALLRHTLEGSFPRLFESQSRGRRALGAQGAQRQEVAATGAAARTAETAASLSTFGYDACVTDYMTQYLNKAEVKEAIHANANVTWAQCSVSMTYEANEQDDFMEGVWRSLIESGLRLHVYSGDDDSICGPIGTQDWIYRLVAKMGLGEEQAWGAWYYIDDVYGDGQVGGYHARWSNASTDGTDGGATGPRGISFTTVHHAGHEVPMYQPMKGLHVFENYINGTW